ncbi:MAG: hypothetical protein WDO70_07115 [Alphaproteobacteria bacterium]
MGRRAQLFLQLDKLALRLRGSLGGGGGGVLLFPQGGLNLLQLSGRVGGGGQGRENEKDGENGKAIHDRGEGNTGIDNIKPGRYSAVLTGFERKRYEKSAAARENLYIPGTDPETAAEGAMILLRRVNWKKEFVSSAVSLLASTAVVGAIGYLRGDFSDHRPAHAAVVAPVRPMPPAHSAHAAPKAP